MTGNNRVKGVGPDEPLTTNDNGGRQSVSPYRLDLVPATALLAVAEVLKDGADKYGEDNWKRIDVPEHLNHALQHIYAHLAGDRSDEHLLHATCRLLFAVSVAQHGVATDERIGGG